jgi:hypothetical protein
MNADLQYISDCFLIERLFSDKTQIRKQADLGSMLGGIGGSIKSFIQSQISGQDASGIIRTILNFLSPAIFFRLHPVLGMVVTAAQLFGFDIYGVFESIISRISSSLQQGTPVAADEINSAAKSAMGGSGGGDAMQQTASLLKPLYELEKTGQLDKIIKTAKPSATSGAWSQNQFVPGGNTHWFYRMFSFLAPAGRKNILAGIVVWFVKTILLSAGLLAGGGAIAGMFGAKPPGQTKDQATQPPVQETQQQSAQQIFRPTGAGRIVHRPNPNDLWIEQLNGENPGERILRWLYESYPDLYDYNSIVVNNPTFRNVVNHVGQTWESGKNQWAVPAPYKTKDEILGMFVNDVFANIQRGMR